MVNIKIILGSIRPGRFGVQPAEWIKKISESYADTATFELIDLKEISLPFLDEAVPASYDQYANDHTKAWAKVIGEADGFVFVTSEYNHSIAPSLKNAIDFLYKEWNYKPVAFLGYGADAGGARAIEHLRGVAGWIKMYDISEHLLLREYYLNQDENGAYTFSDDQEKKAKAMLDQLVFWAETMKPAREQLADKD